MLEILIYLVAAISALFITGFAIHMFVGGLVSPETENDLIIAGCVIVVAVIAFMVWDVMRARGIKK